MPYRGLGSLPDKYDPRDRIFEAAPRAFIGATPPAVDMRNLCSPVRDQGHQGSCTGFALAALREFWENKTGKPKPMAVLSPAFIYYEERGLEGTVNQDAGAYPRDGLKVLASMGVCPETDDPYNDQQYTQAPSQKAARDAKKFKISSYERITTLSGLKQALAGGAGCLLGIWVYASFESPKAGHVPMPKANEERLGGHALFCCGYQDGTKYDGGGYLIIKNSWGTSFGDKGYVYLPYGYVRPKLMSDIWTASV